MSKREADLRAAEESHQAQQAESAERFRALEEKVMAENGRLHSELVVITGERSQLRDNCAKLENDCLAFQELSNDMLERCERLCIELERLKRSSESGNDSTAHTLHEECQRTVEQAYLEVQALKDENSQLTMILEMERLKNFSDERPTTTDSQTDTVDLEFHKVLLSASSGEGERLKRGEGDGGTGENKPMSLLLGRARTARDAALQLRHLLNAGHLEIDGEAQIRSAVHGELVPDADVETRQLAGIVEKLVAELEALAKSLATTDSERTVKDETDGRTNENNCVDLTAANSNQLHELQQLLQVNYCKIILRHCTVHHYSRRR